MPLDDLIFVEAELLAATTDHRIDVSGVEPAIVWGRRSDLTRLLRNLVDNATRHAATTVRLACRPLDGDAGAAVLQVADDGTGIAPSDRARIFERFTRLDEARDRDRGGSGLGLAIVRAIADDHGASVRVEHGDGGQGTGSRFIVTFPLRPRRTGGGPSPGADGTDHQAAQ